MPAKGIRPFLPQNKHPRLRARNCSLRGTRSRCIQPTWYAASRFRCGESLSPAIDPEYDSYKRGAFLEQTNRFDEDKPSDVPGEHSLRISLRSDSHTTGPGAYDTRPNNVQNRPPTRTSSNSTTTDRLAILQRKLEELERVHAEEKKAVSLLISQHEPLPNGKHRSIISNRNGSSSSSAAHKGMRLNRPSAQTS